MSVQSDITTSLFASSLAGLTRGTLVKPVTYPLEVIKTKMQASCLNTNAKSCFQVTRELYTQDGKGAFFRGLKPQLARSCIKQAWGWPVIICTDEFLKGYSSIPPLLRQGLIGVSIATVDAGIGTPFERLKMAAIDRQTLNISWKNAWMGCGTQFTKLCFFWPTFLITQKYCRDQLVQESGLEDLTILQLADVGVKTAVAVSLISAPADLANTMKQIQNLGYKHLLSKSAFKGMYRSWPLSALSLVIQNISSVILLDKLEKLSRHT